VVLPKENSETYTRYLGHIKLQNIAFYNEKQQKLMANKKAWKIQTLKQIISNNYNKTLLNAATTTPPLSFPKQWITFSNRKQRIG